MAIKACLLVLAFAGAAMANQGYTGPLSEPLYTLQTYISVNPDNSADRRSVETRTNFVFNNETHYEWESYDGWYNNPSHPDWGGAGKLKKKKLIVRGSMICCCIDLRSRHLYPNVDYTFDSLCRHAS